MKCTKHQEAVSNNYDGVKRATIARLLHNSR